MPHEVSSAEALLDDLTAHLDAWRPGRYAGHLYVCFVRAQGLVAALNAADRPFYAERLRRLAERAGIVLAPSAAPAAPIAIIRAAAKLIEVDTALADVAPRVEVRAEAPGAFTVWCDRVQPMAPAPAWLLSEIDAGLRLFRHLGSLRGVWRTAPESSH